MRRLFAVVIALLALGAAPALAQDATPTSTPTPAATDAPDDGVLEPDEIPPEDTPQPEAPPCGENTPDAVYGCTCSSDSPDADYQYCEEGAGSSGPPPAPAPNVPAPAAATQTRPVSLKQLPLTGGDPALVALFGLGLLMTGLGLRRAGPARSG